MPGKPRISGAVFSRDVPNGPVFSGIIEIDGVKTAISLWEKTSAAGNQYLQISEDKRGQAKIDASGGGGQSQFGGASKFRRPVSPVTKKPEPDDDMDGDSIPF